MTDMKAYTQGIVAAAAVVVRTHDLPGIAQTILEQTGVINCTDLMHECADYDLAPLRKSGVIHPSIKGR